MSQSLVSIFTHIIFSTKNRYPFIDMDIEKELYPYITKVLQTMDSNVLKIGGTEDHIHILCYLPRTKAISEIVEKIKTSSSQWIKTKGMKYEKFFWQVGYSAFSIGQSGLQKLISYIENQKEHHKKISFQEEVIAFLKKYKVAFDEHYIWD